jgi:hypothetical protein
MNGNAGELLRTMMIRQSCQQDGITNPPESVKYATNQLVEKLQEIEESEEISTVSKSPLIVRYIRVKTGEVLTEIYEEKNI